MRRVWQDRFWDHVHLAPGDGCWEWKKSTNHGYGQMKVRGKMNRTHRLAWEAVYGFCPSDLCVCHRCDNRKCCRPDHLFLGTNLDNVMDKVRKGRTLSMRGSKNPNAKLSESNVAEIRSLYSTGAYTHKQLAQRFGVGKAMMSFITTGRNWASPESKD